MAARDKGGARPAGTDDVVTFKNEADASGGLFDLRYLIGGLFTVYGVVLVVASFFVSNAKAGGINIDLWLGLGMLILGVLFLVWARSRPLRLEGPSALARADEATAGDAKDRGRRKA